ncbi:hypothetical protein [Ralstonia syzygii]|uniref:Uncharacterized protein n=1 Tax=Ralstonia syzygii R24 TaxID=907261 RepID=G2ZYR5_9RALS|nr:hypothetical protein [Ralstonia syzygii]CCA84808.1 conserved hypothetical protein [Ralstonia syzygii R24]
MQTTTYQPSRELQARLEAHQAACARFEAARDEADRIDADAQTQRQAAEAAETEAQQARAEVAQLLRKPGASTKEIHRLKGKERAAYTLAEDYRAVVSEYQAARAEAAQEAGINKAGERAEYASLLALYADELMRQAEATLGPLLHAMWVQELAYERGGGQGPKSPRDGVRDRMYRLVDDRFSALRFDPANDAVLQAAVRPTGLDRFDLVTHAALYRDRVLREQAATQQN